MQLEQESLPRGGRRTVGSRIGFLLALLLVLPLTHGNFARSATADSNPGVTVTPLPNRPIIEARGADQFLNFDMTVRNGSPLALRLAKIELSVYDGKGRLVRRTALNTDAFAPSIAVIGDRFLEPGGSLDVFNPFAEFDRDVPLNRLEYSFCFLRENGPGERERNLHRLPDDCDFTAVTAVSPLPYADKTDLVLPLHGKTFVWDGHGFYAHHLRVPFGNAKVRTLGITANTNEFASDFIYVDEQGREYGGDPRKNGSWYSYGKTIYAPGAGIVRAAENDIPDNWFKDAQATEIGSPALPPGKDPTGMGNFVLIDHQDGEFSLLCHMIPGSVTVKAGDRVVAGQQIGRIGFSGDAIFPHLHYSLMAGPRVEKDWGLPAYFAHFRLILGTKSIEVERGPVETGDFVESEMRRTTR